MAAQPDPALGQTGKAAACGACSLRPAQPAETPGCHFLQRPQGSLVRTRGRADACRSDLRSGPTATASQLRAAPSHPHPSCPDHCPLPWQRKLFLCPHLQAPHTLIRRVEPDAHEDGNGGRTQWKGARRRPLFSHTSGGGSQGRGLRPAPVSSSPSVCPAQSPPEQPPRHSPAGVTPSPRSLSLGSPQPAALPDPTGRAPSPGLNSGEGEGQGPSELISRCRPGESPPLNGEGAPDRGTWPGTHPQAPGCPGSPFLHLVSDTNRAPARCQLRG